MRPLIEYPGILKDQIAGAANWKYVGKVALVIVPAIIWTAYWTVLQPLYKASNWINETGGKLLEEFMNDE